MDRASTKMITRESFHKNIHRCLSLALSANNYAKQNGIKKTLMKVLSLRRNKQNHAIHNLAVLTRRREIVLPKWSDIDRENHPDLNAIGLYKANGGESYTNIVTDSIGRKSLFGGVGTALILGTLLANRRNQPLRIITRSEPGSADDYAALLRTYDLSLDNELIIDFAAQSSSVLSIPYTQDDLFITTSWWTTYSCLQRVKPKSILYLIQEDERSFYPVSDLYLECERIMRHSEINFAVNSRLLWEHFTACGFNNIIDNGCWFDPNFDRRAKPRNKTHGANAKRNLFFYARPNNPRNLFRIGINTINQALLTKTINPDVWNIQLVGSNIDQFSFDDGTIPEIFTGLSWPEYLDLISKVDIGISLMATPHPSYPPLDLASAGAVAITNKYGVKKDLSSYSRNIICCSPTVDDLLHGIRKALEIRNSEGMVECNIKSSSLFYSWHECLKEVISINA